MLLATSSYFKTDTSSHTKRVKNRNNANFKFYQAKTECVHVIKYLGITVNISTYFSIVLKDLYDQRVKSA